LSSQSDRRRLKIEVAHFILRSPSGVVVTSSREPIRRSWALFLTAAAVLVGCSQTPPVFGKKPPGASGPASKLSTGTNFRGVVPTGLPNTAIGIVSKSPDAETARLVLVGLDSSRVAKPETVLADAADADSVRVSTAAPHAAIFLRSPNADGIGTLSHAALDSGTVTAVPSGSGVPAEGFWLGTAGDEILFTANYSPQTDRGVLFWSDGKKSSQLAEDAIPSAVLFSRDRKTALVAVEVASTGVGKLLAITMSSGAPVELASGVPVVTGALAPRFALSTDGSTAAWVTATGAVAKAATTGGTPSELASNGDLPALSPDGKTAAWWESAGLVRLADGAAARTFAAGAASTVPAWFSANGSWIVYCTDVVARGGGSVGDCWVAHANEAEQPPLVLGKGIALDSVRFSSDSSRVTAVADLADPTGTATFDGLGRLVSLSFDGTPAVQVASGVRATDSLLFPVTGRVGVIAAFSLQNGVGEVFATAPTGDPVRLGSKVVPGSLSGALDFDSFAFLAEAEDDLLDGIWRLGTLQASSPNGPARLLHDSALMATYSPDGRILAVIARGEDAGIWSFPAP
jgi:hypothetical protein